MQNKRTIGFGDLALGVALFLAASSGVVFGQDGSADLSSSGDAAESGGAPPPSAVIVASVVDPKLRLLLEEVLERNPGVATVAAESQAAAQLTLQ